MIFHRKYLTDSYFQKILKFSIKMITVISYFRDTLPICENESVDGIHYHGRSHTVYCTSKNVPQNGENSYHQRWFDTPSTLFQKVYFF